MDLSRNEIIKIISQPLRTDKFYTINFRGLTLTNINLNRLYLENINFNKSHIVYAEAINTDFLLCDFKNCVIEKSCFEEAKFSAYEIEIGESKRSCLLNHLTLKECNFKNSYLPSVRMRYSKVIDCDFSFSNMELVSFIGTEFINVSFRNTNLTGANFSQCKFNNVDFEGAKLDKVKNLDLQVNKTTA